MNYCTVINSSQSENGGWLAGSDSSRKIHDFDDAGKIWSSAVSAGNYKSVDVFCQESRRISRKVGQSVNECSFVGLFVVHIGCNQ